MGKFICKLSDGTQDYYFEWSTIVDAPVSFGMSREEFTDYYRQRYGTEAMEYEFPTRMKRVDEKGTSSRMDSSVEECLTYNRAGKGETRLTIPQILDAYCVNTEWAECATEEEEAQGKECPIEGTRGEN